MIIRDDKTGDYVGIQCSNTHCETMAPPAAEIILAHGLIRMGWYCSGGTHLCPLHVPADYVAPKLGERA